LEVVYDYSKALERLGRRSSGETSSIWRYMELLPVLERDKIITLGEGGTELVEAGKISAEWGLGDLHLKDETRNPTGAFKDRETTVLTAKALEARSNTISIVSTGNAACSIAAYAARSGLKSFIIVPPTAPQEKLIQISMYGAKIVKVDGNTNDQAGLLAKACQRFGWYNANPGVNPYKMEGSKTIAYEICEQLGLKSPDYVFVPVGNGGLLAGVWKGFKEFNQLGLCKEVPRIIGVESEKASAVADAFHSGRDDVKPVAAHSLASGINVSYPLNGKKAIKALSDSKGDIVTVSDEEILEAQNLIASREGIFAEPAGSASLAGLIKYSEIGDLDGDQRVVCLVTGGGLKDIAVLSKKKLDIAEIPPDLDKLSDLLAD